MRKIEQLLYEYTDEELAIVYKYQLDKLMENTKRKIFSEIEKRKLTETQIFELITQTKKKIIKQQIYCPRCKSIKINITKSQVIESSFDDKEITKTVYTCTICGFIFYERKNYLYKIFNKLMRGKNH